MLLVVFFLFVQKLFPLIFLGMCLWWWFLWVFDFPSCVPCHLNWIWDLHSCETEMYRSPKHRKISWNLNSGAGRDVPAAVDISLQLFLIMERETFFNPEFFQDICFNHFNHCGMTGFSPSSMDIFKTAPAPKCIWKRLEVCVPRAVCLLPQWWENTTGLCCLWFGHWHCFHSNAADCLVDSRPTRRRNQKFRGKTGVGCVRLTDSWFCSVLGKLRLELNLDIGILGGGFKYFFMFTPIWGRWTHFDKHIFQMGWFNHQPVFFLLHECHGVVIFVDNVNPRLFQSICTARWGYPQLPVPNVARCCRGETKVYHPHNPFLVQPGWATRNKNTWLIGLYRGWFYCSYIGIMINH